MNEQSIFMAALEFDASERGAFLDDVCAGKPELRQHVERLLLAHESVGRFMEQPAAPPLTAENPVTEAPAALIACKYKLLEQIGEGGMGTVWMAQQTEPVKRLVAVKLIKAGMDSKQVIARFEAERQALALMDHPNIAKVLDAGTVGQTSLSAEKSVRSVFRPTQDAVLAEEPGPKNRSDTFFGGRPYFVMELVKGVPITKYCDEHHLTPRQRLELFGPVCQAIQHAHQKGIIHRDLKPSNVLVTSYDDPLHSGGEGRVRGVPKIIDFGVAKAIGQPLTDQTLVTGFGAIVGTLEYMSPEQAEINQLDIDTRSDIYSLGVLLYELLAGSPPFSRKELDKAGMLEMLRVIREQEPAKPSTKLSTADGLPTLAANRSTEPAKLTKLVRGELDWIVMKALEKDRGRRYETANGFAMDVQRYLADEAVLACPPSVGYRLRKFARRNRSGLALAGLVLFFLVLLGSGVGWEVRDRQVQQAELERAQSERTSRVTEQVSHSFAEARRLMADQQWPEALIAARRAELALASGDVESSVAARAHHLIRILAFVEKLEHIRATKSQWTDSGFDYRGSAERYANAFKDFGIDMDRLSADEVALQVQSERTIAVALITSLDDWAECRRATSDGSGAAQLLMAADLLDSDAWRKQIRKALRNGDTHAMLSLAAAPERAQQASATLVVLSNRLLSMKQADSAVDLLLSAAQSHPSDFWVHFTLGMAFLGKSPPNYEQAAASYRAALAVRPRSTATWHNLGNVLRRQQNLTDAIACYDKAIAIDPKHYRAHVARGALLCDNRKDYDGAIAAFREAIRINPKYAIAHNNLGMALWWKLKFDDAIAAHKEAIRLDPDFTYAHYRLGCLLAAQGQLDQAIDCYRKAIAIDPDYAYAHFDLGRYLAEQQKLDESIISYSRAADLLPNHAMYQNQLAEVLATCPRSELRNPSRAVALAERAVALEPSNHVYWLTLGIAQYRAAKWTEARMALEKSCQHETATNGKGNAWQWLWLAMVHWQLNQKAEARLWYEKAVKAESAWPEQLRRFEAEAAKLLGVSPVKRPATIRTTIGAVPTKGAPEYAT